MLNYKNNVLDVGFLKLFILIVFFNH